MNIDKIKAPEPLRNGAGSGSGTLESEGFARAGRSCETSQGIDCVRDQMAAAPNDTMIQEVGALVTALAEGNPGIAAQLCAEGKTLKGAVGAMAKAAKEKKGSGNCVALSVIEGMRAVLGYYGIEGMTDEDIFRAAMNACGAGVAVKPQPAKADALDLDALLGGI